jgi:8-oxo-dGTP pyrophosphatase MutT (NUDIX family)
MAGEREDLDEARGVVGHRVLLDDDQDEAPDLLARLRSALLDAGLGPTGLEVTPQPDPDGRTLAAGLVLLYPWRAPGEEQSSPYLVLTRRTTALRRHSGQISLPGGRYDAEDRHLLHTALRETEEELGVPPDGLEIWGRLEPEWIVASHYSLAPFVAYTPQRPEFRPAPAEVAEVIEVPLSLLLDPEGLAEEIWEMQNETRRVSFYRYGEHKIWGATARVLGQVMALLDPEGQSPPIDLEAIGEHGPARLAPGDVWPPRQPRRPS